MTNIKVTTLKCVQCKHEWLPRQPVVKICPKCKSMYWDKTKEKYIKEATGKKKGGK